MSEFCEHYIGLPVSGVKVNSIHTNNVLSHLILLTMNVLNMDWKLFITSIC